MTLYKISDDYYTKNPPRLTPCDVVKEGPKLYFIKQGMGGMSWNKQVRKTDVDMREYGTYFSTPTLAWMSYRDAQVRRARAAHEALADSGLKLKIASRYIS